MKDDIELLKRGVLSPTASARPTPPTPTNSGQAPLQSTLQSPQVAAPLPPKPVSPPVSPPPVTVINPVSAPVSGGVANELPGVAPLKAVEPVKIIPPPQTIETLVQPKPPEPIVSRPTPIMPTPTIPTIPTAPAATPPTATPPSSIGSASIPATPTPSGLKVPTIPTPSVPPSRGGADVGIKPLYVVIVLVLLLVLGIGIYFIASSGGGGTIATKTPVPTQPATSAQPTTVPNAADIVYTPTVLQIKDTDTVANLRALLGAYNVPQGQVFSMAPTRVNESTRLPLRDFLTKFSVALPPEMDSSFINTRDYIYGVVAEQSADTNTPSPVLRPFFVIKVQNLAQTQSALQIWEPTLLPSLAPILDYSPVAGTFKQEFVNGVPFRYIQSPDAQHGVAYIIIDQYLLIASSRESFRAVSTRLFSLANQSQPGNTIPDDGIDALDEETGY